MKTWLTEEDLNGFGLENFPYGVGKKGDYSFPCTRLGKYIINLKELELQYIFSENSRDLNIFQSDTLNRFLSYESFKHTYVRNRLIEVFSENFNDENTKSKIRENCIEDVDSIELILPIRIGDYTDFYASIDHATNVGKMFRDPANALLPNWKHLPVGYHGRSSSIIVSGTNIHRPKGQIKVANSENPIFGSSRLLDFELEMGFVTRQGRPLGQRINIEHAEDYIFGLMLLNDWSARDIQKWEYVPLGPFLGKSFATSVSPWIIPLAALKEFKVPIERQDPRPLDYLMWKGNHGYDVELEVEIIPESGKGKVVCNSNFKHMYWSIFQMLAHHTVNGCSINSGDLMASGTISGPIESSFGSMLEISWKGQRPIKMPDGSERKFLENGDTVIMRGISQKGDLKINFGEVSAKILPPL